MRKFLIALFLASVATPGVLAETLTHVTVWSNSGETSHFALSEQPVVTFEGNQLVLVSADSRYEFLISDVDKFTFTNPASVELNEIDTATVVISLSGDEIKLSGLNPGSLVSLYAMDGRVVLTSQADSDGVCIESIASLSGGIYLIRTESKTFKILKK